ncbi:iron complex transport system ATP-binding protein [Halogranum amylolyticum]|uniref:Cobalamin import ATP-binding protein BtuD n=1 Tax=Halogranum amylolyticum TaxID=660520 RepID=A0A1H8P9A9_9EURY|nr:heme ABC transporter ATP-binding protein [Halogranum amylolyticum]SEO38228.1 iron complex transport system ATP-binding protein [Halogranum amylolyticum]
MSGETPVDAPLLSVDDVAVSLGGVRVLDGVNASADSGTFVGLVGPNGAGKTTLLRTLNAALTPDRGTVRIDGADVSGLSAKEVGRLVATVPQDTSLSFDFSVRQTVEMGRTPYLSRFGGMRPRDQETVERAMARTTVEQFADRSITEISGGERQRVLLARALAQDTPLLLLDEPTASLDINHQVRTLELVRDLVDDGKTVVAAIHDLNLAAHYCDDLLLLGEGRILASGAPESVLTEATLERAFGANAVVSRHPVTGSVYVTALPDRPTGGDAEGRIHVVGGGGSAARYLYLLSAAGYEVSVGALNEGDSDTETARQLGLDAVTVDPFAPVDPATRETVRERIERADVTLVADVEVGEGNLANLEAVRAADEVVLVETRPFAERNYAGETATRIYEGIRSRATVATPDEVVGAVTDAVARVRSRSPSGPAR